MVTYECKHADRATAFFAALQALLSFKDAVVADVESHPNLSWIAAVVVLVVVAIGVTWCVWCSRICLGCVMVHARLPIARMVLTDVDVILPVMQ